MTPKDVLLYEALRFALWAVGEGLGVAEGDARSPDDFLMDYSVATDDTEWETLAERLFPAVAE